MSLSYTYNGAAFEGSVPPSSLSPTQMADGGQAAFGGLVVDDAAAEILTVGHKAFTVEESDCSQPRLFTGWTTERDMARSVERGMIVGDDRLHDVTLIDLNALFNFRQISGTAADRPEESWGDRLAWILASDFLDGLIADTGFVMAAPPAWECDAADYRGQYPSAVLNDLLEVSNTYELTYFAFWDPAGTATSLFLGAKDSCIGTSTLSISNDASEYDGTACFFPSEDTILARKPDQVFSEVTVNYRSGTKRLFRSRTSIASNFIRRGTNYDVPRVYSDAAASIVATAFLNRHSYEIDLITTTIRVPKASAGLVQAGQRINVKFTHLPGYTTTTSMRVVECTPVPIDDLAAYYDIRLVLELPKPGGGGESETDCPDPTPAGTWYPLGGSGNTPNATVDGYIIYGNGGELYTYCEPDPGFVGEWHFPAYGAGGEGTYDYAGSLAENFIRIPLIGPGSLTFVSKAYSATDVPLIWTVNWCDGGDIHQYSSGGITAGGSVTVAVPASDDLCGWFFQIGDNGPGGTKWGWASATWATGADDAEEDQGFPPGSTLGETPDVNIGTPSDGDVLVYDSDSGTWGASPVVGSLVSVSDGITTVAPTSYLTVPANSLTDGGGAEAVLAYVTPAYGGQETLSIGTASGTAFTIDIADGNVHDLTLGSDCTLTFTGATANVACSFTMLLRQDGTGGWEVTWPAELEWSGGTAPTLDTTASTVTALAFFTVDGGTSWYGFAGSGGGGSGDVATDTIWDALGDIAVGTAANAAAVLSVGTDGYVLTADSGEALGVKWAAAAGGGAVATDTIWDAKGDIAIGTAANAAAVLGVGTDGYVLTADSGEATGVKWAAGSGRGLSTALLTQPGEGRPAASPTTPWASVSSTHGSTPRRSTRRQTRPSTSRWSSRMR